MTEEFLLRLLHSVDGINERDIGSFFGFDERETGYVIREAEEAGHVTRKEGRLWLTIIGRGLFRDGSEEPQIYEVEKRTTTVGFDLLAIAPAQRKLLGRFEVALPELRAEDAEKVSGAGKLVSIAFRRFYGEIRARYGAEQLKKRSLYSIDNVVAGERFSSIIRVLAKSKVGRPGFPEPDLSAWRTGYELDDRSAVIERSAAFLESLKAFRRLEDGDAYKCLVGVAPEFLEEFVRRGELNVERYFRETVSRVGEIRSDRPTIPVAGSLFTEGNVRRLFEALRYALERRKHRPQAFFWLVPQVIAWGTTRVLPVVLDQIERQLGINAGEEEESPQTRSTAFVAGRPSRHLSEAFDMVIAGADFIGVPPTIEMFVVPGLVAAVMVHAPIGAIETVPVPLGILSFDDRVVRRAQDKIGRCMPSFIEISGKLPAAEPRGFVEEATH